MMLANMSRLCSDAELLSDSSLAMPTKSAAEKASIEVAPKDFNRLAPTARP